MPVVRGPEGLIFIRDTKTVSWSWSSLLAGAGTDFFAGGYLFSGASNTFAAPQTIGTANRSYAAHAFIVTGAVPAADVTITITGTGITDLGVRDAAQSVDIVIPAGTPVNSYFETDEKWLGTATFTLAGGPATLCNWGYAKYWDNNNMNFMLEGIEVTGEAFLTDAAIDLQVIHHRATGWTFNVGADPTFPAAIASLATDYGADAGIQVGQEFAWKRVDLDTVVQGNDAEGIILASITSVANSINGATVLLSFRDRQGSA